MREVYDQIAPSWYNLRHWTRFEKELREVVQRWGGGRLLNIGCAHGPDFLPFKDSFKLWGVDFSPKMLTMAKRYCQKFNFTAHLVLGDAISLPFASESFDWVISIATLHHIKGKRQRTEACGEIWRVLRPEGEAFITVWNRWQPRFWFRSKEITIPWKSKGKTLHRYFYLFSPGELQRLLTEAGFDIIRVYPEKSYHFPIKVFSQNICLLVKKRRLSPIPQIVFIPKPATFP
jgi:ubiquinone/menaquinone biosynthesis C-methylase UbiE